MLTNQALREIIKDEIHKSPQKCITFAQYMDLVLYHPQFGYYSSGHVKIGAFGDFFTSSSLCADFGELLAEQFVQMWEILGKPANFKLVEMGAGTGNLAKDVLQHLENNYSQVLANFEYIIIEQSEALREQQQKYLENWSDKTCKLSWQSWQEMLDNSIIGCFFSNELVDAFPVHKIIIKDGELAEICVTISEDDTFVEITVEPSTQQLIDYFQLVGINLPSHNYPDNYYTEVNLAALNWLETVARKLRQGYLLTIDYGYTAERYYHPQRYQGTIQCYYKHRFHDNPYINIGYQDITAHVDFTALENQGKLSGLTKIGFSKQSIFLMALGLGNRLFALSDPSMNLETILKRRDVLHQLIDPSGLGSFGVLIQSKGLNEGQRKIIIKGLQDYH